MRLVKSGIQIVAGKIEEAHGRIAIGDKSGISTLALGGGGDGSITYTMTDVVKMLVRGVAAEFSADTGDAASYIVIQYTDGTNTVEIKRDTGTNPNIEWSGKWIDRGRSVSPTLVGRIQVYAVHAGVADPCILKVVFNIEKVA